MNHRTFHLTGATGGACTTTVALMLAITADADVIVGDPDELQAVAGASSHQLTPTLLATDTHPGPAPETTVIVDGGTLTHPRPRTDAPGLAFGVVRGPSYIAAKRLSEHPTKPDGLILVAEPGRALSIDDLAQATGTPVVASIAVDPSIARAIDAGLILSRIPSAVTTQFKRLTSFTA